jgi:hypothetical protein
MDDLLGSRDPIEVLSETADVLARIVSTHPLEQMRARPFEGKWTPNEVIGHLLDAEWVYGFRMRLILCEDSPTILGMDQENWVTRQHHNDRDPRELLEPFRTIRHINLSAWRSMSPADLARTGRHDERGPESLGTMLKMLAGHDLSHIDQIERYLAAVKAPV